MPRVGFRDQSGGFVCFQEWQIREELRYRCVGDLTSQRQRGNPMKVLQTGIGAVLAKQSDQASVPAKTEYGFEQRGVPMRVPWINRHPGLEQGRGDRF